MRQVYILLPLLTIGQQNLTDQLHKILKLNPQQYDIHPIDQEKIAVQLHSLTLGYSELTHILEQHQLMQQKLVILENCLREYDWSQRETSIQGSNIDSLVKKAGKYKELKEENKKLKKLLQNQLQNTEKVREQTQRTMKVLREQFDTLVKDMSRQGQSQGQEKDRSGEGSKHPRVAQKA